MKQHEVRAHHKDQVVEELQSFLSMEFEQPGDLQQSVLITRPSNHDLTSEIMNAPTITNFKVFEPLTLHVMGVSKMPYQYQGDQDSRISIQQVHQTMYFSIAEKTANVPFLDHLMLEVDCNGREYTNVDHDITLRIPEGAVAEGEKVHFEVGVAMYGPCIHLP